MDSLGAMNQQPTKKIKKIVARSLDFPKALLIKLPSVQQPNGFDCGVYVIANVELVGRFYAIHQSVWNVPVHDRQATANKRQELVAIVQRMIVKQNANAALMIDAEMPPTAAEAKNQ